MSEAQRSHVHVADATEPLSDMPPTMPPHHLTTNDKEINGGHINEVLHSNTNGVQAQEASVNGTNTTNWPAPPPPIAVVGMALRLPGGIKSPDNLWDLLMNKGNARSRIPKDRYNIDAFHGPEAKPGEVSPQHGYFLEDSLEHFDAGFFAMSKAEVAELDPQQKLLLEVVWECMESGGQTNWRGTKVGCYVGVFGEDWLDLCSKDTQNHGMYRTMGTGDFAIANRVSYEYDLKGPSMTIRTGCSSALIGLHEACESLYSGHCSSAIVAGTNLIITPTMTQAMTMQRVLSPTGSCKTFDAKADGYARGEAINAIFIKKLDDALRDGDPIRAVIRATASNFDGKTAGISNPSSEAHEEMMRSAYSRACLSAPRTAYVECHGTGTPVGDPLETTAVGNVFRGAGVYIGSVKPNVGHSEGASGITSLIKAVLALENRIIPPNINFSTPNPKIPFEAAKLRVPLEPTQWPADRDERASVNSFGIGGTNVHVIIDSAASFLQRRREKSSGVSTEQCIPLLLPISANTTESLRRLTTGLHNYLDQHPGAQDDIAYTLASRRDRLPHRTFGLVEKTGLVHFSNFIRTPRSVPKVNFVFTGQGAQWAGMGVELMEAFPRFRHDIQYLDSVLQPLKLDSSWSLEDALLAPPSTSRINDSEFSQPLCTALQIALVNLLKSWGISPSAVVGHSSGEIAAAYASGAISAEGAIIVAFYRGQVTKTQTSPGGMAAIGLGREAVVPYLRSGVVIACENSPSSVTLSGDLGPLDAVLEAIREAQPDTFCRKLRVAMAYHSHHMSEIGESYELLMDHHIQSHAPQVPFYSSVYGKRLSEPGSLGSQYWRANLERPVLFYTATRAILNDESEPSLFLEIGPHSALAGPLRQIFQEKKSTTDPIYVATLARNESQVSCMLKTAGQLFQHGIRVDFDAINGTGHVLTNLPTYPWQHDISYWKETRISRNWRLRPYPHHELLGSRILESSDIEPSWRNVLDLENVPWLRDHKIVEDIVFPAAGYIAAVGEAIRQTTGSKSYCIRRLVVKSALVIQESQDLELITNFKPYRLTDSLESEWYEFTIASYNGSAWIQHCTGQARASAACEVTTGSVNQYPRVVQSATWYSVMKKMGLNYGPRFQQLNGIKVHPTRNIASANVWDDPQLHKSAYAVHPTTIDQTLQLFTVAMSNGLSRRLNKLAIPSTFGEIYIGEAGPEIDIEVEAHVTPKGAVKGSATATNNGKTVISLNQGLFSPLEIDDSNPEDADSLQAVRLEWQPDINFMQDKDLMRPVSKRESVLLVEKVALLCMIETYHQIKSQEIAVSHLSKFRDWLHKECERMAAGEYDDTVPEAREWTSLTSEQRLQALQEAQHAAIVHKDSASVAPVAQRVLDSCLELVQGKVAGVELLIEDEGLASIYNFYQDMMDFAPFFRLQSHAKPTLRVLEIGAGTGGTTSKVLEALHSAEGVRMYSKYHYTDISSGFFPNAKERFKNYAGIDYSILDISKDPLEQGFEMGTYDVIIASNVLHATPSLHQTLTNVRKLTAPGGRLFLQELSPRMRWTNYIMGILPGWWLGEADDRPQEPFITPSRWDTELRAVGFSGVDTLVYDDEEPYQTNAHMITTAISTESSPNKTVALLYQSEISTLAQDVGNKLEEQGFGVKWYTLDQEPERNETVISLLDLDSPFLYEMSSDDFKVLQSFLSSCNSRSCNIIWVTKPAQVQCQDPRYGLLPGFARTIRSEMSLNFATFEAENFGPDVWVALAQVAEKFGDVGKDEEFNPEFEYAYFDGKVHTSRFHWISSADDQEVMTESAPDALVRLSVEKYGSLDSLEWKPGNPKELVGDEVEIEIKSVGLNFRDVLVTMGIVDGVKDMLGLEGSGVVRRIAPGVKDLHIGDRVFICDSGCFATRMVTSEKLCARIPDSLDFEEAATMPCVYNTVIHSLVNIGGLESGQSVLIHSACGGVGIAAIQVCRMLGAEIFATVGNEEKVHYLMDTFGIPRSRIFDSRSASFLPDLMRETDGRGADLVLNSLSGELLHASWQCVAEFGKMLEIGKRDFIGRAMLSMDVFQANRSFVGIDLAELGVKKPKECQKLLKQCLEYYAQGSIEPIRPMKAFEGARIGDAFRYMQKGQHIGKIVINMPESAEALVVQAQVQETKFRPDSSYLLIGGLGGLGRALSTWMVERGARSLVYLSRSAGDSSDDRAFFDELKAQNCEVTAVKGSVAVLEDVARGIELAPRPIAGVVQMSMVLRDANFLNMTHEDWNTTLASKVRGTWNLHKALQDMTLDFFLLFSSISGIVGQWGQSNYAAANTFLDSFVQYRQNLGLPASVIDVGVMGDVGYVSQNAAMLEALRTSSAHTLGESDLLGAVSMAIKSSTPRPMTDTPYCNRSQLAIGMASTKLMTDPSNRSVWKRDLRMALYRNRTASKDSGPSNASEGLKEFLSAISSDPEGLDQKENADFLTREIGLRIKSLILSSDDELDPKRTLADMGVDSLVSIEIRNWWRRTLGLEISVLEIMNAGSVERLGSVAVEGLKAKFGDKRAPHPGLAMKAP